jgi:hypothetical protein
MTNLINLVTAMHILDQHTQMDPDTALSPCLQQLFGALLDEMAFSRLR